jgi:hypothetical protein
MAAVVVGGTIGSNHRHARLPKGVSSSLLRRVTMLSVSKSSEGLRRCAAGSNSRDASLRLGAPGAMRCTRLDSSGVVDVDFNLSISSRSSKHRFDAPLGLIPLGACRGVCAWVRGHAPL